MADAKPDPAAFADAAAVQLGLDVDQAWRPGIVQHLKNFRGLYESVVGDGAALPDDPAAVYRP
ncbi:MAG: hypothetical protein AB7K86_13565 [Rhodospirillales bacterium]